MTANARASLVLFIAACAGCAADAPQEPTWAADVRPILAANCVRCHTYPALGDAPRNFRLDRYDAMVTDRGDVIYGARTVAQYVCLRTGEGTMPPRAPLRGRHKLTLERWFNPEGCAPFNADIPERGNPAPGNRLPSVELRRPLDESLGDDGRLSIAYQIDDPDFDIVTGTLLARPDGGDEVIVTRELHGGRGEAVWDVAAEAEGSYELIATLEDGSEEVELEVASYEVVHPDGNTAPRVAVRTAEDRSHLPLGPMQDVLISDADSPFDVIVEITDPDAGGDLTLTLVAVLGNGLEEIVLADDIAAQPGENIVTWDTEDVTQSANWQLRATVREGDVERTHTTLPFIVGHGSTDLVFTDGNDGGLRDEFFNVYCTDCHLGGVPGAPPEPGVDHDFFSYGNRTDDNGNPIGLGVRDFAGAIYRRVVQERTMPPTSAALRDPEIPVPSKEDREALAEWLLAGAPEGDPDN